MKKISLLIFMLLTSFLLINKVDAASATISVSSNKTRVIVGDTVTVTIKVSSSNNLGSWTFDVSASSNLTFVSSSFGGLYIKDVVSSSSQKNMTYTFVFKAKSSGSASVAVKNSTVYSYDESVMTVSNGSVNLNLMTQAEVEASYSKNNNLSSLTVEGYELTPKFDKNVLEYELEVENGINSVNIKTSKEDNKSSVSGSGVVNVSEGLNKLEVVVTAENGSKKTYIINLTVKELDPIDVTVDGKKYTVIQKKEALPEVGTYYSESVITLDNKEIPAYYNEITKFTLVGLKDDNGNVALYLYENDNYKLYKELRFNANIIYILDMDKEKIPNGYKEEKIVIDENAILAYVKDGYEYPIIYGLNVETGEKSLYKYDAVENTLQRYENVSADNNNYLYIIYGMFGFIILSYVIFITIIHKKNKKSKLVLERTMKLNNIKEDVEKIVLSEKENKKINKKLLKEQKKKSKKNKNNDDEMASF